MTETISPPETLTLVPGKQQLDILNGQDRVLAILDNFASKDMPGRQKAIQDCVNQILTTVTQKPAAN